MDGLDRLMENGILGILLSLSIGAIVILYREVQSLQNKRVQEAIESRNKILEPLESIKRMLELILEREKNQGRMYNDKAYEPHKTDTGMGT